MTPQTRTDADILTVPTAQEERLRELIRAELDRRHARPVARRTLALMAEASVEATDADPPYRVVDRRGASRLHPASEGAAARPFSLGDLVDELRERHPDLFAPPPPEPELPPEPPHDPLADMKAAGARFVETQSALARSLATHSAERGRALASAATGRIEGWRRRLERRLGARSAPAPVAGDSAGPTPGLREWPARGLAGAATLRERSIRLGERSRDRVNQGLDFARSSLSLEGDGVGRRRAISFGLAGLTLLAVIAAVVIPDRDETPAPPQQTAKAPETAPPPAESSQVPDEETPAPEEETKPSGEAKRAEPAPRTPNEIAGVPEVIDTATLRVSGKLLHLFGVEWVRGGQADELTKYLAGRSVSCLPAPGSSAYTCTVEGRDVSEVVLFNGGGRASAEASTELVAAEDHARTERLGVWKR